MSDLNDEQEVVLEIKSKLALMNDEDVRIAVGMIVTRSFESTGALTQDVADLVAEYKRVKPHLAKSMDAFIASGATTEP